MAKTFGGRKRDWKTPREYRAHLREMVKQGKGHNAEGSSIPGSGTAFQHMLNGYRLS